MSKLIEISKDFESDLANITTQDKLNDVRVKYLGKAGVLTDALKAIKDVPVSEKKEYGESVNKLKREVTLLFLIIIYLHYFL